MSQLSLIANSAPANCRREGNQTSASEETRTSEAKGRKSSQCSEISNDKQLQAKSRVPCTVRQRSSAPWRRLSRPTPQPSHSLQTRDKMDSANVITQTQQSTAKASNCGQFWPLRNRTVCEAARSHLEPLCALSLSLCDTAHSLSASRHTLCLCDPRLMWHSK